MDFLDPKKKRKHIIRLYIGYVLMTVVVGLVTYFLVNAANGLAIDRGTGQIIQNGLVIVDAHPESARISIDGIDKGTTDNRLILPEGDYNVELKRDGYRSWNHKITLEGKTIEQLVYPVLFPTKLITKSIQQYDTVPTLVSTSPDRHWAVIKAPAPEAAFNVIDLSTNKHPVTTINLPSDTLTAAAGAHTFEAIEWASDNNHLLLKHTFTGGHEFLMLNRENPAASVNLTKLFANIPITTITLRDKKADQFYIYNAATTSLLAADSKTRLTTVVASRVLSYKSYQADTLLYTTNSEANPATVDVHVVQNSQDRLLRTLPVAQTYLLDMAQFDGRLYLLCGSPADGRTYVYKDPFSDYNRSPARTPQPFRVLIVKDAQYVSFSAIARFVAVQGGSNFAVYDAETGRQYRFDTKLPLAPNQKATWMDGHRLSIVSGGLVNIFDFDGTNLQSLSTGSVAFAPFFDRDYTGLFTLAPAPNAPEKTAVLRTELKVLPAGQ